MRNRTASIKALFIIAAILALFGCGSGGSNNDQGVVQTFLGYFSEFADDCEEIPDGELGRTVPLVQTSIPESLGSENAVLAIMGFQNSLSQQFFRIDRLFYSYRIPGSDVNPPSTTLPVSILVGPSEQSNFETEDGGNISSLPPAFDNICNRTFAQYELVPADINAWLGFNAARLPEAPFYMVVTVYASGVTSAGDRYDTNTADFIIEYTPAVIVPPTPGGSDSSTVIDEGVVLGESDDVFFEDDGSGGFVN